MMRRLLPISCWILIVLSAAYDGSFARAQAPKKSYFEALLEAGRKQNTHMGIVFDEAKTLSKGANNLPQEETIAGIVKMIPGYVLLQEDGVAVVEPRSMPDVTQQMMNTVIEEFRSGPATVSQMSQTLWMDLQIKVVKPPPQTFWGVLHTNDDSVTAGLSLANLSVRSILNHIILTKAGTAWIVLPPPASVGGADQERLWNIVRYASASEDASIRTLCCINWELLQTSN